MNMLRGTSQLSTHDVRRVKVRQSALGVYPFAKLSHRREIMNVFIGVKKQRDLHKVIMDAIAAEHQFW
jgi:hypothetical protein